MSSISNDTFPCKSKMKGEIMSSRLIGCMHNVQIKNKKNLFDMVWLFLIVVAAM